MHKIPQIKLHHLPLQFRHSLIAHKQILRQILFRRHRKPEIKPLRRHLLQATTTPFHNQIIKTINPPRRITNRQITTTIIIQIRRRHLINLLPIQIQIQNSPLKPTPHILIKTNTLIIRMTTLLRPHNQIIQTIIIQIHRRHRRNRPKNLQRLTAIRKLLITNRILHQTRTTILIQQQHILLRIAIKIHLHHFKNLLLTTQNRLP